MPKAARRTSDLTASTNRKEPYTKTSPKPQSTPDKENVDPQAKSKAKAKARDKETSSSFKGDYRDIHLDEVKNEVPCYDNAATVRRKLKKLLSDKSTIPSTSKKWSQASMAAEMQELERRGHAVKYNKNAINGPTTSSLANFLKKSGAMGGGDSPCYYWGYVMLEKLRIYNGEKKSKPREQAEKEMPNEAQISWRALWQRRYQTPRALLSRKSAILWLNPDTVYAGGDNKQAFDNTHDTFRTLALKTCRITTRLADVVLKIRIPTGHERWDPKTQYLLCGPGLPMPSIEEMNNTAR